MISVSSDIFIYDDELILERISRLSSQAAESNIDAVLITPGSHLNYFSGISGNAGERLLCLVVGAKGSSVASVLIAPEIELEYYWRSGIKSKIPVVSWRDGQDPLQLVLDALGSHDVKVVVSEDSLSRHIIPLLTRLTQPITLASNVINAIRMYKDSYEVVALQEAGAAIDKVHALVPQFLRIGRTEAEVAADITAEMLQQGHTCAQFVIVGSGPHGALPHHSYSERIIESGDIVVVDIGGPMKSGYYSDSTRTYSMGKPLPHIAEKISILQYAQALAVSEIKPGKRAEEIDYIARSFLHRYNLDQFFSHRLGHGIGLSVHEAPDIVTGNTLNLEPGIAFSVEPGIYFPGQWGARIEDIVIVTEDGALSCNNAPHELVVID